MNDHHDYYAILCLDVDADAAAIRKAFRARLLEAHPDKSAEPTDPERRRTRGVVPRRR